jgi:hypothetical protein
MLLCTIIGVLLKHRSNMSTHLVLFVFIYRSVSLRACKSVAVFIVLKSVAVIHTQINVNLRLTYPKGLRRQFMILLASPSTVVQLSGKTPKENSVTSLEVTVERVAIVLRIMESRVQISTGRPYILTGVSVVFVSPTWPISG